MLKITEELLNGLKQNTISRDIWDSYIVSIVKFGSKRDCDILFEHYLSNLFDFKYSYLFPSLFEKFGDKSYSEKLLKIYIKNPKMVEESNPEILRLLGYFKNNSIKEILKQYALENNSSDDLCRNAVLGLLNFNCTEYEKLIEEKIVECYNKNLFPEYVPALVCKLANKEKILPKLFVLGNEYASTDCNAGIVLGFSLCGDIGKKYFIDALNNPYWELDSSATGTIWAAYEGVKNLKISFKTLYLNIKKEKDNNQIEHLLSVFFALLERRIEDYDENIECFTKLYHTLFNYCGDNDLIDLARKVNMDKQAYVLKQMIELKVTEELILRNY